MKTITIDPMTRLEGHGKIRIVLDEQGEVERALVQIPELRGFEAFVVGRPAVDMPQITSRICGVCPTAHHMAATKALDNLYGVTPPLAARCVRELIYNAFMLEDHALHFYVLGGPDLIVGPSASGAERNVFGLFETIGREQTQRVLIMRRRVRDMITDLGGKVIHPVFGLPGGVSKAVSEERRDDIRTIAADGVEFARMTLELFHERVLNEPRLRDLLVSDRGYFSETNYMGLVNDENEVDFYDGHIRVVKPDGSEHASFEPADYATHIAEHVEDWTYAKFPYLRNPGWKGFTDGADSGVYRVAPLARLNVAEGMATPRAHEEYERLYETLGAKPAHNTLAYHWARLVELMQAAERLVELSERPELCSPDIRNMDYETPRVGVGCVEAPRGTLIHHYETDEDGIITACNLLVATVSNSAALCLSVERAARQLIHAGRVDDGLLNMVEMAFRAYDPCLACASRSLRGEMPLSVEIVDDSGNTISDIIVP